MKNVVMIDPDLDYLEKLGEYLDEEIGYPILLHLFAGKDGFEYLKKQGADLVFLHERFRDQVQNREQIKELYYLTEEEGSCEEELFKYQKGEAFIQVILTFLKRQEPGKKKEDSKVYVVYSPRGGCGKTSFALGLAKACAEHGPTLFLNLDCFEDFSKILNHTSGKNLSDVLYYYLVKGDRAWEDIAGCMDHKDGIDYFFPTLEPDDFLRGPKEDWISLFEFFNSSGRYQYLVFDPGGGGPLLPYLLQHADKVFLPKIIGRREVQDKETLFLKYYAQKENFVQDRLVFADLKEEWLLGDYLFEGQIKELANKLCFASDDEEGYGKN